MGDAPLVGVIMGSRSDWETMRHAVETLEQLGIPCETRAVGALHARRGRAVGGDGGGARPEVVIAGAGMAAALPGVVAAKTVLPVLGVPVESKLNGLDSLLSMSQMPAGIPVGVLAIGRAGAVNAALLAPAILARSRPDVRERPEGFRAEQAAAVLAQPDPREAG